MEATPEASSRSVLLAGGLAAALAFTGMFFRWDLLVDDAFISFRYAENLVRQGQLVFNAGEQVEGYSNLLWTLLLAAGAAVGIAPPVASQVMGYLLGAATLGLCYVAGRRTLGLETLPALYATVLLSLSVSFTFWVGAGLESALFALLVLGLWAGLWSAELGRRAGPGVLTGLAALIALTRPEGVVFALLLPATALLLGREPRRRWLWPSVALLVVIAAHLVWRHAVYGAWLPNAAVAKVSPTLPALGRGARYLWGFVWQEGLVFLLPLAVVAWRRDARFLSLAGVVVGYAAFIVYVGGDGLYRYRLGAHVAPCLMLLIAAGLDRVWRHHRRWFPAVAGAAAVVAVVPVTTRGFFRNYSIAEVRSWESRWELVGQALARDTQPEALLATNVIGRVPYYSGQPTLDLLGLTDPVIARQPVEDFGRGYAGHERAAPEYVLRRQPDLIYFSVLDGLPESAFASLTIDRQILGAGSLYRYAPLLEAPGFRANYAPAFLKLADGRTANLFVRVGESGQPAQHDGLRVESWQG